MWTDRKRVHKYISGSVRWWGFSQFFSLPSASPPDFTGNVLRALLKAKAGSTVTLECKPQAFPIASILWKKGNLPIHTNDR